MQQLFNVLRLLCWYFPAIFFAPYTFTVRHILRCFRLCLQHDTNVPTRNCYPVWNELHRPGTAKVVSLLSFIFTSAIAWTGVHIAPKYGTKPVWYATLHFRDGWSAALLRHRNLAEITKSGMIFVTVQKLSGIVQTYDDGNKLKRQKVIIISFKWNNNSARWIESTTSKDPPARPL